MNETLIQCPNSGTEIPVSEVLRSQIRGELEKTLHHDHEVRLQQAVSAAEIRAREQIGVELQGETLELDMQAELERHLNTLGTIASITPLLGLLGTVIGMIKVFSAIMVSGVGNPNELAGGISEALITTAAGLSVAIPSLMFHRYFSGQVNKLVVGMEEQALKMVEVMKGQREQDQG